MSSGLLLDINMGGDEILPLNAVTVSTEEPCAASNNFRCSLAGILNEAIMSVSAVNEAKTTLLSDRILL